MVHTIEPALSGRAKCRGCGQPIAKGELRFGERLQNPFGDAGELTLWFHLACGAYRRPEALLEALEQSPAEIADKNWLADAARKSLEHRRLPRVAGAELSSTGRAKCRSCGEKIPKDGWRVRLAFFEDGRFDPGGFVHLGCAGEYFGTHDLLERLTRFSPDLSAEDRAALEHALKA